VQKTVTAKQSLMLLNPVVEKYLLIRLTTLHYYERAPERQARIEIFFANAYDEVL
jgi:hypothetical protein